MAQLDLVAIIDLVGDKLREEFKTRERETSAWFDEETFMSSLPPIPTNMASD